MVRTRDLVLYSLLFGIAMVAVIVYQVGVLPVFQLLAAASLIFIVCYLATSLIIAAVLTLKWKVILNAHGIDVPYHHLFTYRMVGYSVSYLTPSAHVGGEPIRAYLLQRDNVPINTAFSTVIIDKTVELATDVLFFIFGALVILHSVANAHVQAALIIMTVIIVMIMGAFLIGVLKKDSFFIKVFRLLRLHKFKRLQVIERNLEDIEAQIKRFYRLRKDSFLIIVILMILLWILMFLEYRFALLILGHFASPLQIFLVLTGVGIAYAIPIPAAIGTLEISQLSAAAILGLSAATAVGLAFIVRTRDLIWTVIGLVFLGVNHLSFKKLSKETTAIDTEFRQGRLLKNRKRVDIERRDGRFHPEKINPRMRRILARWRRRK